MVENSLVVWYVDGFETVSSSLVWDVQHNNSIVWHWQLAVKLITLTFLSKLYISLVFHVDDIVISNNDQDGTTNFKKHLFQHSQTKEHGKLKYFLGI